MASDRSSCCGNYSGTTVKGSVGYPDRSQPNAHSISLQPHTRHGIQESHFVNGLHRRIAELEIKLVQSETEKLAIRLDHAMRENAELKSKLSSIGTCNAIKRSLFEDISRQGSKIGLDGLTGPEVLLTPRTPPEKRGEHEDTLIQLDTVPDSGYNTDDLQESSTSYDPLIRSVQRLGSTADVYNHLEKPQDHGRQFVPTGKDGILIVSRFPDEAIHRKWEPAKNVGDIGDIPQEARRPQVDHSISLLNREQQSYDLFVQSLDSNPVQVNAAASYPIPRRRFTKGSNDGLASSIHAPVTDTNQSAPKTNSPIVLDTTERELKRPPLAVNIPNNQERQPCDERQEAALESHITPSLTTSNSGIYGEGKVFETREERNIALIFNQRYAGPQDIRHPTFFDYGIRFQPPPDEQGVYRTVSISGIPIGTPISSLLRLIRGGMILSVQILDTIRITGHLSALVIFTREEAAKGIIHHTKTHPLRISNTNLHVRLVETPTYPIPWPLQNAITTHSHTRVLLISNLTPETISLASLRKDLHPHPALSIDLIEFMEMRTDGVVEVRFTSIAAAGRGYGVLRGHRGYRSRGVEVVFGRDPCSGPFFDHDDDVEGLRDGE
ncbi:hypothetical protein MMC09_006240 [Bachmanniomyces sp. S44760]|nr:hypothetical protein [Bachmanniomyces sp. S44760]